MAGKRIAIILIRILVTLVFLVSGFLKVVDPSRFLIDVRSFGLLPYPTDIATALALPWLEILCAFALWWKRLSAGAALLLGTSALAFIAALMIATTQGTDIDCGCFGDWLVFPNLPTHIAFNACLFFATVALWRNAIISSTRPSPD